MAPSVLSSKAPYLLIVGIALLLSIARTTLASPQPQPSAQNLAIRAASPAATTATTTTSAQYSWVPIPSPRPNCVPFDDISPYYTATYSAAYAQVTAIADPFGGLAPFEFAGSARGKSYLVKTLNATSILASSPGKWFIIADSDGIVLYDTKCKMGGRLRIPNFLAPPSKSRTIKRDPAPAQVLPRKPAPTQYQVSFSFIDTCGNPAAESLSAGPYIKYTGIGSNGTLIKTATIASTGKGTYVATIPIPSIKNVACTKYVDKTLDYAQHKPSLAALRAAQIQVKHSSTAKIKDILKKIGATSFSAKFNEITLIIAALEAYFAGGASPVESDLCTLGAVSADLIVTSASLGQITVDSQSSPFQNTNHSFTVPIPRSQRCNPRCPNYSSDPKNCGSCGNVCLSSQICFEGICKKNYNWNFCTNPLTCPAGEANACSIAGEYCYDIDGSTTSGVCDLPGDCPKEKKCEATTDCATGFCALNTCCGFGVCRGAAGNSTRTSSRISFGHLDTGMG